MPRRPVSVIDDLGPDREGRATEHDPWHAARNRFRADRPSAADRTEATDLPLAAIEQHYGGAIASRVEMLCARSHSAAPTEGVPVKRRTKNAKAFHDKCENG
jgi:hypothetical protein